MQLGAGRFLQYRGAEPNFVLLAAVFIALNAPPALAAIACVGLGVAQDFLSVQPIGLFALSYGLTAAALGAVQTTFDRRHWFTHLAATTVGGAITAVIILGHELVHPPAEPARLSDIVKLPPVREPPWTYGAGIAYTALLAPIVLGLLSRTRRAFGFQTARRGTASLGVRRE